MKCLYLALVQECLCSLSTLVWLVFLGMGKGLGLSRLLLLSPDMCLCVLEGGEWARIAGSRNNKKGYLTLSNFWSSEIYGVSRHLFPPPSSGFSELCFSIRGNLRRTGSSKTMAQVCGCLFLPPEIL